MHIAGLSRQVTVPVRSLNTPMHSLSVYLVAKVLTTLGAFNETFIQEQLFASWEGYTWVGGMLAWRQHSCCAHAAWGIWGPAVIQEQREASREEHAWVVTLCDGMLCPLLHSPSVGCTTSPTGSASPSGCMMGTGTPSSAQ